MKTIMKTISIEFDSLRNDLEIGKRLRISVVHRKYLQCTLPNLGIGRAVLCLLPDTKVNTRTRIAHKMSRARVNMPENVETTAVRLDHATLQAICLPATHQNGRNAESVSLPRKTITLLSSHRRG